MREKRLKANHRIVTNFISFSSVKSLMQSLVLELNLSPRTRTRTETRTQEAEGQKTNNGIQYRLQLLYTNGQYFQHRPRFSRINHLKSQNAQLSVNNS